MKKSYGAIYEGTKEKRNCNLWEFEVKNVSIQWRKKREKKLWDDEMI